MAKRKKSRSRSKVSRPKATRSVSVGSGGQRRLVNVMTGSQGMMEY